MYDFIFRHWIFHTERDLVVFRMKPYVENIVSSCPPDSHAEDDEEHLWSVSVTNLPNDVFDDENTKVCRDIITSTMFSRC